MEHTQISFAEAIQQLNKRLDVIEQASISQKTVLTFKDFCTYVGISKSFGYKITSSRAIPYSCPNGKTIFFDRAEVDKYLLQNPIKTKKQLKKEVLGGAGR
jgi:excisionase family DNA binding protein